MRRLLGALLAGPLLASMLFAVPAQAADPIKIVVPFAAGGPVDALARILAQELTTRLASDVVVVENRGGAGGVIAVEQVARAPADGRTILFASVGAFVITNALRPQPGYDPLKSFAPVARVGAAPTLFIVKAESPIKTLDDLIAKAKQGKMSFGSAGAGTTMHIAAEQLNASARTKITHVPYRGVAPALNDIMGGHIDFLNADITVLYPLIAAGTIRAVALAGTERSPLLPDVPTTKELGHPDIYMENWYGALVPAATPPDVIARLEAAIMDAVRTPAVWDRIAVNGVRNPQDAKAFRAQIEKDIPYWNAEIKKLGITGE